MFVIALFLSTLLAPQQTSREAIVWLEDLDIARMTQEWGSPRAGSSVERNPIRIGGREFAHGVGTHAVSEFSLNLGGEAVTFKAMVGVDDETQGRGSVEFQVIVDDRLAFTSGVLRGGQAAVPVSIDLTGASTLTLMVLDADDGIDHDHADWANAMIVLRSASSRRPVALQRPPEPTPEIASGDPPQPRIHGPRIVGATPGHDFLFRIPATGEAPLTFSADNLPAGLNLDPRTGIIAGRAPAQGKAVVTLHVRNRLGEATRKLAIVTGEHKLALTPPLGWNSWNVWAGAVDDAKVRAAAEWMVKSGLAAKGFQYINVDDCWEGKRGPDGVLGTNEKFPDMKALADYVHSLGLKFGVYSSPGPKTCAGFEGSYGYEELDARTWAAWGVDYIKYDWCSYGSIAKDNSLAELQKPYYVMRDALDKCGRDIVYSLCQYGMGEVWKWGAEVGGNCWRTTGDITDTWASMSSIGFGHDGREKYAGPGGWNDPDMLVVGVLGWGPNVRPTRLTPNEQITHITLWCLLASPLLLGCDLSQLDKFTIDLLTNSEVLDVNQDPLGKAAGRKAKEGMTEVWARPLWDGTVAVGLFNRGSFRTEVTARWSDLGLRGRQPVRDLWRQRDLGIFDREFSVAVPSHGAVFVKIGTPREGDL
ncbi:MAG: NPCBM/NEW2 domain-containing protein [Fimbriimonadia bacterium]